MLAGTLFVSLTGPTLSLLELTEFPTDRTYCATWALITAAGAVDVS